MPTVTPDPEFDLQPLRLRLSQLRSAKGWSYDELAARTGLGRATVVSLESGKPRRRDGKSLPPSSGTLTSWWKIAKALDMDLSELVRPLDRRS